MDPMLLKRRLATAQVPALPVAVTRLMVEGQRPSTSANDLVAIVETEPGVTARILQFSNSPVHGFPHRIGSLSHAVVVLGASTLANLALEAAVFDIMKAASLKELWRHSLGVGVAARTLGKQAGRRNLSEIFTAGLLHDMGKMVLHTQMPDLASTVAQGVKLHDVYWMDAEYQMLGATHADIGLWLANLWQLPTVVREPMAFHHHPEQSQGAPVESALVHVADIIVKAIGFGNSGDDAVPPLSSPAWRMLNLDPRNLTSLIATISKELESAEVVN